MGLTLRFKTLDSGANVAFQDAGCVCARRRPPCDGALLKLHGWPAHAFGLLHLKHRQRCKSIASLKACESTFTAHTSQAHDTSAQTFLHHRMRNMTCHAAIKPPTDILQNILDCFHEWFVLPCRYKSRGTPGPALPNENAHSASPGHLVLPQVLESPASRTSPKLLLSPGHLGSPCLLLSPGGLDAP